MAYDVCNVAAVDWGVPVPKWCCGRLLQPLVETLGADAGLFGFELEIVDYRRGVTKKVRFGPDEAEKYGKCKVQGGKEGADRCV